MQWKYTKNTTQIQYQFRQKLQMFAVVFDQIPVYTIAAVQGEHQSMKWPQ